MAKMIMPQLGESVAEGMIVRWMKQEGEQVAKDELIVEVSTDKVDSEIPSPTSGILSKILVPEGETVDVGKEIAEIEEGAARAAAPPEARPAEAREVPGMEVPPPEAATAPAREAVETRAAAREEAPDKIEGMVISPIVRRLAKEEGIDLAQVRGTGEGGRITKQNVLEFIEKRKAAPEAPPPPPPPEARPKVEAKPGETIVPFSHIRKQIAERMVRSRRTAAHVTTVVEVDMTRAVKFREAHKDEFRRREGYSLTYLPFVSQATIEALLAFPYVNSTLVDSDHLILRSFVNLGIAVAYEEGLIVPVIKHAEEKNLLGLARAMDDLVLRAREKRLNPDDVANGTFTITNPGVFGSVLNAPIINYPQVAILSLEQIAKRPVVIDDAIAIRHMVYLPLSYDHRVVDGAMAVQFLSRVKKNLEEWDESSPPW